MEFVEYDKIAEAANWRLNAEEERKVKVSTWVVTEKIHGSNFSFIVSPNPVRNSPHLVRHAKRKQLLAVGESFFNFQPNASPINEKVCRAFDLLSARRPLRSLHVFGELFGGAYPHPDVPVVVGAVAIQTGVWYSPAIEFCVFDIALQYANPEELDPNDRMVYHPMEPLDVDVKVELPNRSPNSEECLPLYLDFDALVAVCQAADLLCVRPLARGRLCEVQDFQLGFESTWPRRLGLPPLPNSGANVAEGVVLRPVQPIYAANHAHIQLKRKVPQFAEDSRFHGAIKPREAAQDAGAQWHVSALRFEALALVNDNRLDAAISKVGPLFSIDESSRRHPHRENVKQVLSLLSGDALVAADQVALELELSVSAELRDELVGACKELILARLRRKE